jgi:hypothetical protein
MEPTPDSVSALHNDEVWSAGEDQEGTEPEWRCMIVQVIRAVRLFMKYELGRVDRRESDIQIS